MDRYELRRHGDVCEIWVRDETDPDDGSIPMSWGEVLELLNERDKLQARVRELEGLAGEAVEVAQFYGDQCEEWYQKKYDYDKVISELKERLSKPKGTL